MEAILRSRGSLAKCNLQDAGCLATTTTTAAKSGVAQVLIVPVAWFLLFLSLVLLVLEVALVVLGVAVVALEVRNGSSSSSNSVGFSKRVGGVHGRSSRRSSRSNPHHRRGCYGYCCWMARRTAHHIFVLVHGSNAAAGVIGAG